jgi:hypothetical protein
VTPFLGVTLGPPADRPRASGLAEDLAMTIEIFHFIHKIQRWLDAQVARHLEAQATRLAR